MIKKMLGFGVVEVLFTVLIIALITAIAILFIPMKSDNRTQEKDIDTISKAIVKYSLNNKGNLPTTITEQTTEICKTTAVNCKDLVDLSVLTQSERYLISIPVNPLDASENGTGYFVKKDAKGKVEVTAIKAL